MVDVGELVEQVDRYSAFGDADDVEVVLTRDVLNRGRPVTLVRPVHRP